MHMYTPLVILFLKFRNIQGSDLLLIFQLGLEVEVGRGAYFCFLLILNY